MRNIDQDGDFIPDFIEDLMGADLFKRAKPKYVEQGISEEMYIFEWRDIDFSEIRYGDYFTVEGIKYEATDVSVYKSNDILYKRIDGTTEQNGIWLMVEGDKVHLCKYINYYPEGIEETMEYDNMIYNLKRYGIAKKESSRKYDDTDKCGLDKTAEYYILESASGETIMFEMTDNYRDSSTLMLIDKSNIKAERVKKTLKAN